MFVHQADNSLGNHTYCTCRWKNRDFQANFHRGYELIYIFEGRVELMAGGRQELLEAGDFALVLSNEVHQLHSLGATSYWICVFSSDFVPEFDKAIHGKVGSSSKFRCDDSTMAFLIEHVLFSEKLEARKQDFFQLTAGLHLACGAYLRSTQLIERNNKAYTLMNTIADYIAENFRSNLTLTDTAAALGYDYYYFSRMFRRIFGMGFGEYLNLYRFSAASSALRNTNDSIVSIAMNSGFQSIRAFNALFLKKTGLSPTQYRNQLRSGDASLATYV